MLVFDRFWNAISLNRSVSQRVTSIQSNDGRYLVLSYDADGGGAGAPGVGVGGADTVVMPGP